MILLLRLPFVQRITKRRYPYGDVITSDGTASAEVGETYMSVFLAHMPGGTEANKEKES